LPFVSLFGLRNEGIRWSYEKERGKRERSKERGDGSSNSNRYGLTEGPLMSKYRPEITSPLDTGQETLISVTVMSETDNNII
jgi:hypothetical protein